MLSVTRLDDISIAADFKRQQLLDEAAKSRLLKQAQALGERGNRYVLRMGKETPESGKGKTAFHGAGHKYIVANPRRM